MPLGVAACKSQLHRCGDVDDDDVESEGEGEREEEEEEEEDIKHP